jgi:RNA polymerase sigma factor (sigma-70 family)
VDAQNAEKELIERCIRLEEAACERLYRQHSGWLYSVCLRYLPSKEDAQDVLQEAFILIFKNLPAYSFNGSFKGWMRRITVNCALGFYRRKEQVHAFTSLDDSPHQGPVDVGFLHELNAEELLYFIERLSPGRRQVFNAFAIEGYSHKEIAELLGISEGTSRSQFFDAKRELKKAIEENYSIAKTRGYGT